MFQLRFGVNNPLTALEEEQPVYSIYLGIESRRNMGSA